MKIFRFCVAILLFAAVGHAETVFWSDGFENNSPNRWTTSSVWKIGSPTTGPVTNALGYRTFDGTNCATTGLTGGAGANVDSRLICTNYNGSTTLTVPAASQYPRLRYWQWFNFVNSGGYVEISTNSGSTWQTISTVISSGGSAIPSGGIWSRPSIDLRAFAGENVQIAFHFTSGINEGTDVGWYVDDVAVVTGTPVLNNPESFEGGLGDWSVNAGTWQVGVPANGTNGAYSGTNCAETVLAGNYSPFVSTMLISPAFVVPTNNPELNFSQWYKFVNAGGVVEITTNGGSTWQYISSVISSSGSTVVSSGGWYDSTISLSAYANQTVQIAFYFESGDGAYGSDPGWLVDNISLPNNNPIIDVVATSSTTAPNYSAGQFTLTRSGNSTNAVTVNFAITGTATNGVNYTTLPSSVTLAAGQYSTNLLVISTNNPPVTTAQTVVLTLTTNAGYFMGLNTFAVVTILPDSSMTNSVSSPVGMYWRGSGQDPTYWSQVVPLEFETGTVYSNLNGNCITLYPGLTNWISQTFYHYNVTNPLPQTSTANRIPFNNPIVAFGERVGGTPLYISQPYSYGISAGDLFPSNQPVVIQAYYRSNYQLAGTVSLYPPYTSNTNLWNTFQTNGFQLTTNAYGLTTSLACTPGLNWGSTSYGSYVLTHTAGSQATNYYYVVEAGGSPDDSTNPMVINSSGQIAPSALYSLEFEQRPPWRSAFLDQPHFNGSPLPPFYAGMTLAEMLTNTPPVTNAVSFTPSAATNLDDSPELRRHPVLDNFVASMGNDPIALANYVINQIGLTDPMDVNDDGNVAEDSINPPGVTRGALGTFMEKQGSPIEQCALLVYLLRQAGVPAVYEYAPHNGLQILDSRLSEMLKFQVHGDNQAGQLYTTNTMIPVNYPWVAAYIGTNWVHIFPWLKDYEIDEGLNLFDEMPTNYSNAYEWARDYIYGNTNLLSLAVNGDNTPRVVFPQYLKQMLLQNHPGVSVDDIGVQIVNRQHYYARWQDFPTPTWVTNVSTPLESLSSSTITNINPVLTNVFDTVSVEIYSLNDLDKDIQTGDMRLCDLHDREFYISQTMSNSSIQLNLVLVPFRTNITSQAAFANDTNLLSREVLSLVLDPAFDYQLGVRFHYHRHRAITPAYPVDPSQTFLGLLGFNEIDIERPLYVGDQAAICQDYGQVTTEMLNFQAQNLWQMESQVQANHSLAASVSPDVYEGETMYLAGLSYYEKVDEWELSNEQLQKFNQLSSYSAGLSKITPARDSYGDLTNGTDPVLPCVDMFFYGTALVGNGSLHPNSGQDEITDENNFNVLQIVGASAEEHQVINRFYQETNAVSTVRLLQLAQSSGAGIVPLTLYNYTAQGQVSYQGQQLQNWDSSLWQQIVGYFQGASAYGYVTAFITPGPVSNGAYTGMGALILDPLAYSALISPHSLNGGFAGQNLPADTIAAPNTVNYNVGVDNGNYSIAMNQPASGTTLAPDQTASFDVPTTAAQISSGNDVVDPQTAVDANNAAQILGLPTGTSDSDIGQDVATPAESGDLGSPTDPSQVGVKVADPVNNITGEFYVDETDLQLPGPIPLALRRDYSSQNLANNQFGYGWKLSIMPYLCLSQNSTNIYAADMDGAVLAYVHQTNSASTNLWMPTLAANPQLNNNTVGGVGGLVNRLRDYIQLSVSGSVSNYTLYGADGSVRVFQFMNFNSGTITNARPYLLQWTDNRGNFYTFSYDTNSGDANFGQMSRILCSNGNYLDFDYDIYGHMIDAYSGDGRWMYYDYDEYGDLVTVTLPDSTTRSYEYLHSTQSVTNSGVVSQLPYSTHLIIEEDKPDGRELINAYDSQRRVTNQLSTAGTDLSPIRTATFIYSNNFVLTNSFTNTITGYTLVIDGNNHTNIYNYTNNLITKITDPLGQTIQQVWFTTNTNAAGYYPRSVQQRTDKRGLVTQYQYDAYGNVTNSIMTGDLTGDGITSQTATNTALYNTNCLPLETTDPAGNSTVTVYSPTFTFLPQQVIHYAGATPVSTNFMFYGDATNVVVDGSLMQTNLAFGIMTRLIRAYGSPDAATNDLAYNGNGFLTQSIRYSGTSDPNVTNTYFYNERGQMVDQVDSLGAVNYTDYDPLNRPTEKETIDEFGNTLSLVYCYYNENGEINWMDGPRNNPDNYAFYDYDGAGRVTTEIHWRSEANSAGTGVEAPAGYNLYAQTFYQYDPLGNLLLKVDARDAMTTNTYDPLCRLVQSTHLDVNGTTVLSTEGFSYEPGGEVQSHTNALGGVTTTLYNITGKPEYHSNPDGSTNGWRYYLDGRINKKIQSNGAYWQITYNDVNRITTQVFYSAMGVPEATNSIQYDRRGNVIQGVDAGGNAFTSTFDGLDRAKITAGPAIVTVSGVANAITFVVTYVTNTLQQVSTNFYDAAGRSMTNINVLGESSITKMDALGRDISAQIFSSSGTLVRERYMTYTPDHNSVTVTDGSGASAIVHATYTDNDGHTVLSIANPAANATEFTLNQYDLAGNLISARHDSSVGGAVTNWTTTSLAYDGLNRVISKTDRDNALATYAYDQMGDLTNRTMPGGLLQWQASYSSAGQMLQEQNVSGSSATHTDTYSYFTSGSPDAGLLQTKTDGRGVTCAYSYDDWLRPTNMAYNGPLPEEQLTTTWQYEPRGFITGITEQFASTNTGPANSISRSYDPYGQLASESGNSQVWDAAGRRTLLNIGGGTYGFTWFADGTMMSANDPTGSGDYKYTTAGVLTNRAVGIRTTSTTSLDGEGRPLSIKTAVSGTTQLTETLSWLGDGLLASHTLARPDFTDLRSYAYANQSRRLVQEQLNLNASATWTNTLAYDGGVAAGPGALTLMGPASSTANVWSGGADAFSRVNTETNSTYQYAAYGHVNGQSTLNAYLDSQPVSVTGVGTNAMEWRAMMDLSPGQHQLTVSALQPSGQYTAWVTNSFTNGLAYQAAADSYDSAGNITNRVWRNPSGTTVERTQTLSWDARERLHAVTERDASNSGYNWSAVYDALGRRTQTTTVLVSNGVASTTSPQTVYSSYDPEAEFLELGVSYGLKTVWKLYGPDLNGQYGGLNGTGGYEGDSPKLNLFNPTISDCRGNILAYYNSALGAVIWNAARPTGFGAVPGYRPPAFDNGASMPQSSAWRGRWVDITGYYNIGLRPYDPVSGRWLSGDTLWNDRDPNYYSFAGGDPINYFDHDGRMSHLDYEIQDLPQAANQLLDGNGWGVNDFYSYSSEGRDVLGTFFPGQSYNNLDENQRLFAISLLAGEQPSSGFLDASGSANYYNQASASGLNQGGIGGYTQVAAAQLGEDLLDLFGTTSVQQSAMQSGAASADPSRQGAAWGYGALTAGSIMMNAVPGGGKAVSLVEEEGVKVLADESASRLVALDTDAVVKFNSPGVQAALQQGDNLVVTPNVVQELINSVGIKDVDNFLSARGITVANDTIGAAVPATFLRQQMDGVVGSQVGNLGDALNLSQAGGIGADLFITADANTIGRTFGTSGSIFLPHSGGVSLPFQVVK